MPAQTVSVNTPTADPSWYEDNGWKVVRVRGSRVRYKSPMGAFSPWVRVPNAIASTTPVRTATLPEVRTIKVGGTVVRLEESDLKRLTKPALTQAAMQVGFYDFNSKTTKPDLIAGILKAVE